MNCLLMRLRSANQSQDICHTFQSTIGSNFPEKSDEQYDLRIFYFERARCQE